MQLTDAEWVQRWHATGCSPRAMAIATGLSERSIYKRRENMEARGLILPSVPLPGAQYNPSSIGRNYEKRRPLRIDTGAVVIFSDAHWWPGRGLTTANAALLKIIADIKPRAVIANGDVFDLPQISRHEPDGWQNLPPLSAEMEAVQVRMAEIAQAAKGAELLRTIGNHDMRFDRRLATRVPDYRHLAGMQLRDHLPEWAESWSVEINGATIVKHRWHNGTHGAYNNVLKGGRSIVTGHLHRLLATPWSDYNGRRWGVDTGTLADIHAPQFDYAEDAPANWGSGFAVLTFRDGVLLPPEFCEVIHGRAYFRGEVVHEEAAHKQPRSRARKTASGAGGDERCGVPGVRFRVDGRAHDKPAGVQVPGVRKAGGAAR